MPLAWDKCPHGTSAHASCALRARRHGGAREKHAKNIDQPIARLLKDLRRIGMLEDTLVVWTTEFGRTPGVDGAKGRGHHSACFSSWLADAGVKGGYTHGSTCSASTTNASPGVSVGVITGSPMSLGMS
jgi:uncharacterized protein (DUF1501 family)